MGAYEQAVASGASFTEVAGTSAGSIVAALIGAGASPKQLRDTITTLDFKSFTAAPERKDDRGIAGRVLQMKYPQIADLIFDQGFHSSAQIKTWVEDQLARLLPDEKHPVSFRSLPFPTYIVSTDLIRSQAKVWSQSTTPDELVSEAVQASCAIPIFFQPVSGRYVDGGVLSNLPTFVFFDKAQSTRALASRVLAFTLKADDSDPASDGWKTETFLHLLANAVVDGGQEMQLSLQSDVHVVTIPTGTIRATDFDKMSPEVVKTLVDNGSIATRTFFEKELLQIRPTSFAESLCYGTDEVYTRVTESLDLPLERVVISDHNTDWVYSLFPSLLCWRMRGVKVDVIVPELGDRVDGRYRRKLLQAMGVHLTVLPGATAVPIKSYVIIPRDSAYTRAIVGVEKQSRSQTIEAVLYEGFLDASAIHAVLAELERLISTSAPSFPAQPPTLAADSHDLLLSRIRTVGQYSRTEIDVAIENVPVERLVSLANYVREYKYRQIRHLIQLYRDLNIPLFDPAAVVLKSGEKSIVTPPVVEESGGQFILLEGSTRATFCRDEGIAHMKCVVVRGVMDPLPGAPVMFNRVRVVGRTLDADQRYEKFNYANFRSIERAVHPLDSLV